MTDTLINPADYADEAHAPRHKPQGRGARERQRKRGHGRNHGDIEATPNPYRSIAYSSLYDAFHVVVGTWFASTATLEEAIAVRDHKEQEVKA